MDDEVKKYLSKLIKDLGYGSTALVKENLDELGLPIDTSQIEVDFRLKKSKRPSLLQGSSHFRCHTNRAMIARAKLFQPVTNFYIDLKDTALTGNEKWVFHSMATMMDYGNIVIASISEIVKASGISKVTVNNCIEKLLKAHCFLAVIKESEGNKPRHYLVCPLYYSMGNNSNLEEAVDQWNNHLKNIYKTAAAPVYINPSKHTEITNDPF